MKTSTLLSLSLSCLSVVATSGQPIDALACKKAFTDYRDELRAFDPALEDATNELQRNYDKFTNPNQKADIDQFLETSAMATPLIRAITQMPEDQFNSQVTELCSQPDLPASSDNERRELPVKETLAIAKPIAEDLKDGVIITSNNLGAAFTSSAGVVKETSRLAGLVVADGATALEKLVDKAPQFGSTLFKVLAKSSPQLKPVLSLIYGTQALPEKGKGGKKHQ
jgi:hypothetical protein